MISVDVLYWIQIGYAEDLGGNDRKVEFYSKDTQLHAVWDSLIIEKTGQSHHNTFFSHYQIQLESLKTLTEMK
jgi:hypothetical protein